MPDMTKEVLFEITNRTVYPFDDEYVDIVVEADNDSRRINFSVCKYFDGVDLSTKNITIRFNNALQQYDEYTVKDMKAEDDVITFSWLISNKVVIQSGEAMFDVLFWDEDGYKWHTKPAKLKVEHGLLESDAIASQEAFDVYDQWRIEAKKNLEATTEVKDAAKVSETNAKKSETNAKQSEDNAKVSETNAATSETNAGQSEANALASENAAKTSETNAANSATLAKSWAVGGTGTRTNEDFDNAKYYTQQAQVAAKGALGYYPTPERLREEHPTSSVGYWAIVGSTDSIWVWSETKNDWSDATYLTNYYTRTETNKMFSVVMMRATYDPQSIGANAMVQPYTCTKTGTVYALTGSGAVGRCKIPAAFNAGDTFTVNGKNAKAYMGADAVDELAAGRWYLFVIDTEGDEVTVNFKSGRVKVNYTVNHNKQNVNGDGYTRDATQNLVGVKGKYVTPAVNSYTGFTSPSAKTVRLARGTVVDYNYARNKYGWVANHYTMNTDGSSYSYDSQTNGTAFYESGVTPDTKTITGFTSPSTQTIAINTENNEVKYYYSRNKYTVLCIDKCGESELGRGSWNAYYGSTVYGSSRGANSSIDAYYTNYGYTGSSSAVVDTNGATVYRYFDLKRFSVTGANSNVYNPANNPGVWVTGGVGYGSQFSARVGTSVSFNLGVSIDNDITSEHGQEAVAMVWIYLNGSQVYEDSISVWGNKRQHYDYGQRFSYTFSGSGTAQIIVQVKAKQENIGGAAYGNCAAWVDSITCQHP